MDGRKLGRQLTALASVWLFAPSFAADFNPQALSDMPASAEQFVSRITRATSQTLSLGSAPGERMAGTNLEVYYNNRVENFLAVMDRNNQRLDALHDLINEANAPGDGETLSLHSCLTNDAHLNSWGQFTNSVDDLAQLKKYVQNSADNPDLTMVGPGMLAIDRRSMSNDVATSYTKVAKYLGNKSNYGLFADIHNCCTKMGDGQSNVPLCNPDHIKEVLAPLAELERLPSNFVDPLNPGALAGSMSRDDILTMLSLGQMNDFIESRDFNQQIYALHRADQNCQTAREDALNKLGHQGQTQGLIANGINMLHCSLWSFSQNWSKGARSLALGFTKANFSLYNSVSQCPQQIQDRATQSLSYSPQQFQADYQTLGSLPGNIVYSSPVAQPIAIHSFGNDVVLELRDEAGFAQSQISISGSALNPTTNNNAAALANVRVASTSGIPTLVGSGSGAIPVRGRAIVSGTGSTVGNSERVTVRSMAAKIADGSLVASRSLASAVKGRKEIMKSTVARMKADRSTVIQQSAKRATMARSLVTAATSVNMARGVASGFQADYKTISRALTSTVTGRDISRPSTTSTMTSGSRVSTVSPGASLSDQQNAASYKATQDKASLDNMIRTIKGQANSVDTLADQLNDIINQKQNLINQFRSEFDPATRYKELSELGADDRAAKLMSLNSEWARLVKEINLLDTQELGMRISVTTKTNSLQNYIAGAKAFQGLQVNSTNSRGLASVPGLSGTNPNGLPTNGLNTGTIPSMYSPGALTPYQGFTPGSTGQPINLMPPVFNPNMATTMNELPSALRWLEVIAFPRAYAAVSAQDRREQLAAKWEAFTQEYDRYASQLEDQSTELKQKMWERFIINERENRKTNYLSTQVRIVVGTFNSAIREELPDLMNMKNAPRSGINPQVYTYLEQIRRDSTELNELVAEEARLALDARTMNPAEDEESWTGILPAMALQ